MYNKSRIVIIGGSGFLASHLIDIFQKNKYKILVLDKNLKTKKKKGVTLKRVDIKNFNQILKQFKRGDIVYHFAAISDIKLANKDLYETVNTNVMGTTNILEACVVKKVKKIIYSSSIYALSKQGGIYSSSKLATEMIIEKYSQKFNLDFCILRFGSLYGENFNHFNSIGNLVLQAIKKKKIIRNSDGEEIRNYIHVKDAVKICYKLKDKKYKNNHYNLLGKEKVKIKDVVKLIAKETKCKKIFFNKNKKFEDHYRINPYTYKLNKEIFFKFDKGISLLDGIKNLVLKIKNEK